MTRRTKSELGTYFFRPESPVDQIPTQAGEASKAIMQKYSAESVSALYGDMQKKVEQLATKNQRREHYHGKLVLEAFYHKHLRNTGLSKNEFKYSAARHARERKAVKDFFESFFKVLEIASIQWT